MNMPAHKPTDENRRVHHAALIELCRPHGVTVPADLESALAGFKAGADAHALPVIRTYLERCVELTWNGAERARARALLDTLRHYETDKKETATMSAHSTIATIITSVTSKRQALKIVREEANAIIEQGERKARGWDRGMFRQDDTLRHETIRQRIAFSVTIAFALASKFAD